MHLHETITYFIENNTNNDYLKSIISNNIYFDKQNTTIYTKRIKKTSDSTIVVLSHNYNYLDLKNHKILNQCFDLSDVEYDGYNISFYAAYPFTCYNHADNISVTIVPQVKVLANDADEITGSKHIWNEINKYFRINIKIGERNQNKNVESPIEKDSNDYPKGALRSTGDPTYESQYNMSNIVITVIIVSAIILIAFITLLIKKKNSNQKEESFYKF